MVIDPVIFREYDIRGVVGKQFDKDFAYSLGKAYASLHKKTFQNSEAVIAIGHDARSSCEDLYDGLSRGLKDSGFHVKYLGLVTSPMAYFTTFYYPQINGAIQITGSHNPPEYNGFKISLGKNTIYGADILKLKSIIETNDFISGQGSIESFDIFEDYVSRYKKEFGDLSGVRVVLDCGNGAGGVIARRLYEALNVDVSILFEQPDGSFPNHHPDPTVEKNLIDLKKEVLARGAAIGIGFDGDADRIGVVDESGKMILGDDLMVLISRSILKKSPGSKIVGDVKCSYRLYNDIQNHGGIPVMWKTGHSLVKQKIKEELAPFGGELSGHIFFNDRNYGYDDALYAGLRVLEILKSEKIHFSKIISDLPATFFTPEIRIDTTEEKKIQIVEAIKNKFESSSRPLRVNTLDGIRVEFEDGWFLARPSNTQPVLVLRFEFLTLASLEKVKSEIEGLVQSLL